MKKYMPTTAGCLVVAAVLFLAGVGSAVGITAQPVRDFVCSLEEPALMVEVYCTFLPAKDLHKPILDAPYSIDREYTVEHRYPGRYRISVIGLENQEACLALKSMPSVEVDWATREATWSSSGELAGHNCYSYHGERGSDFLEYRWPDDTRGADLVTIRVTLPEHPSLANVRIRVQRRSTK